MDGVKRQYQDTASQANKQRMQGEMKIYEPVLFCIIYILLFLLIF